VARYQTGDGRSNRIGRVETGSTDILNTACSRCRCVDLVVTNATTRKSPESESVCASYGLKTNRFLTGLFGAASLFAVARGYGDCSNTGSGLVEFFSDFLFSFVKEI